MKYRTDCLGEKKKNKQHTCKYVIQVSKQEKFA